MRTCFSNYVNVTRLRKPQRAYTVADTTHLATMRVRVMRQRNGSVCVCLRIVRVRMVRECEWVCCKLTGGHTGMYYIRTFAACVLLRLHHLRSAIEHARRLRIDTVALRPHSWPPVDTRTRFVRSVVPHVNASIVRECVRHASLCKYASVVVKK